MTHYVLYHHHHHHRYIFKTATKALEPGGRVTAAGSSDNSCRIGLMHLQFAGGLSNDRIRQEQMEDDNSSSLTRSVFEELVSNIDQRK